VEVASAGFDEAVGKRGAVRHSQDDAGMAPNFIECSREQAFLMPPSLRDWVPEDHLVWTILEAVEEMDLSDSTPTTAPMGMAAPPMSRG
jgi:hypothetical protein